MFQRRGAPILQEVGLQAAAQERMPFLLCKKNEALTLNEFHTYCAHAPLQAYTSLCSTAPTM